jgi:hypothetical protein
MAMHLGVPRPNLPILPNPPVFANTIAQQSLQPPNMAHYGFSAQSSTNDYFGNSYGLTGFDQLSSCNSLVPSASVNMPPYGRSIGQQIENTALMFVGGFGASHTDIWDELNDTPEMKGLALFTPQQGSCMPGSEHPTNNYFN